MSQFGTLLDCGFVTGANGVYSGNGYAVLSANHTSPTSSSFKSLSHKIHWTYFPIDYSQETGNYSDTSTAVNVLATWAQMPAYCRYCHAPDHSMNTCALRLKNMKCNLCHETGHIRKDCGRKNVSTVDHAKKRKTPKDIVLKETKSPSNTTVIFIDTPPKTSPISDPSSSDQSPKSNTINIDNPVDIVNDDTPVTDTIIQPTAGLSSVDNKTEYAPRTLRSSVPKSKYDPSSDALGKADSTDSIQFFGTDFDMTDVVSTTLLLHVSVCSSCGGIGHKCKNHHLCPNNIKNTLEQQTVIDYVSKLDHEDMEHQFLFLLLTLKYEYDK